MILDLDRLLIIRLNYWKLNIMLFMRFRNLYLIFEFIDINSNAMAISNTAMHPIAMF